MNAKFFFTWLGITVIGLAQPIAPQMVATGLQGPNRMILTPRGNFVVTETNMAVDSGRISIVSRTGARRSFVEAMPSGTEVTLAGGSGPSAILLRDRTLYVSLGQGDWERRGDPTTTSIHNPKGASSPIFGTVLKFELSQDIDSYTGTMRFSADIQKALNDGGAVTLNDGNGGSARVSILTRFPVAEPATNSIYRFSNLWSMALSDDGNTLYVGDASLETLATVDTTTGRWKRMRFSPVTNPTRVGPPVIDSVPTSVRVYGKQVLVSFLTGFPFVPGNSRVMAVNVDAGTTEPFLFDLTSATDVLWRPRPDGKSQFYVIEFSADQGAAAPPPGRLLRFVAGQPGMTVLSAPLITPVSMVLDEATGELFVLELRGQIQRIKVD